ncbi:hypothetical protein NQZ68_013200 [Dissostichus eleginoides]|nr:hypothetical protein NQZ68_013200 [Dissostichus eleginoides]
MPAGKFEFDEDLEWKSLTSGPSQRMMPRRRSSWADRLLQHLHCVTQILVWETRKGGEGSSVEGYVLYTPPLTLPAYLPPPTDLTANSREPTFHPPSCLRLLSAYLGLSTWRQHSE